MTTVVVGGRFISLTEVCLVASSTKTRSTAKVALDPAALAGVQKSYDELKSTATPPLPDFAYGGSGSLLPLAHARAALFARVVHAMQGRSGLRPAAVQFLVDVLNGDAVLVGAARNCDAVLSSLPADGDGVGAALRALLAQELQAREGGGAPLSGAENAALALGSGTLAVVGAGALLLGMCSQACLTVDAVASLTCAAVACAGGSGGGAPLELRDPDATYELRPHRCVAASANALKILLRDTTSAATAVSAAGGVDNSGSGGGLSAELVQLPQVHGPAVEALQAAAKTLAVELNSCERGALVASPASAASSKAFSAGPTLSALRSAKASLSALSGCSRKRLSGSGVRKGVRPWQSPDPASEPCADFLRAFALLGVVSEEVDALQQCLVGEVEASLSFLATKRAAADKATAEAAAVAAAAGAGLAASAGAAGAVSPEVAAKLAAAKASDEARLAAMKPSDRDKYLKKKADKEAKEKAKADAKKAKAAAAAAGGGDAGGAGGGAGAVEAAAAAAAEAAARVSPGVAALQALLPKPPNTGDGESTGGV
eukprot:CAMPEP_0171982038 /NCGR_PEP_ID=MMETSP0993-20121228/269255_1 /TAXON_ID=483369 /ORGANISM="non described non described, Strain CCMP2098" /LENGTH=544 /DNA_ID=CAMNT_0012634589 /DNA_START=28 /DNA_END=1658 /DNA_ORIENTATION=+